ncbi:MAG: MarR family transcriptional regulator [Cereibacter changlensis]
MTDAPKPLGLLMHDAARAIRKRFEQRTCALGLSSAQWRLLAHLSREGRAAQARLADLLEIEPISVSRLLDRMEQGGWVRREPDPSDRRVRIIVPTEKTTSAYATIKAIAEEVYAEALAGVPAENRKILIDTLCVIVSNLSSDADPAPHCPKAAK